MVCILHPESCILLREREPMTISRRRFLGTVASGSMALPLAARASGAPSRPSAEVFRHGVATGDPLDDRVILWTRVTLDAAATDPGVEVAWRVATDPALQNVVARGSLTTGAWRDYSAKVDAAGLRPGTTYYYQFNAVGASSPVGRTKTLPVGDVDRVRLAVVSCSNLPFGYFNVYRCIAERADLDAVLHLGDYLYEYRNRGYSSSPGREGDGTAFGRIPMPDKEMVTLEDYRIRHAQYKEDLDSQEMLRQHPLIAVWDDHESANDSWEDGAKNHDPDEGEGQWSVRKEASIKAYYEWMPIRENRSARQLQIYRSFRYGNLVDLVMLDTRLAGRDEQAGSREDTATMNDPGRSLLGPAQEAWLFGELQESIDAGVQWRVLGQQVFFGRSAPDDEPRSTDKWDGYAVSRDRIFDFIEAHALDNLVVLTGDIHSSWALDVPRDPWDGYDAETGAGSLAVEYVTPAVSSPGQYTNRPDEADAARDTRLAASPHVKFLDQVHRGYFILDITPERAQADWFFVDTVTERSNHERFAGGFYTTSSANHLTVASEATPGRTDAPALAPA